MESNYIYLELIKIIHQALNAANYEMALDEVVVESNYKNDYGDYSTTVALQLAKRMQQDPMVIAKKIVDNIKKSVLITKVNVIKPGFINLDINVNQFCHLITTILQNKNHYGLLPSNKIRYNVEFVSANPTGLLHLGHARNAAIGDSLANILRLRGYDVTKEYYVNDAGNQINNLALSVYTRYQNLFDANLTMPEDSYYGDEIIDCAVAMKSKFQKTFFQKNFSEVRDDFKKFAIDYMMEQIELDLKNFGVSIDKWFFESSLYKNSAIKIVLKILTEQGNSYEKDGATFLATTKYGDDKDRVLIKSDGSYTYMLPDLAYHHNKYQRSDLLINIWGADHDGYIKRIKAGLIAIGDDNKKLTILATQMVRLIQNGVEKKMSKRAGTAVTMRSLLATLGQDVVRYFMIARTPESHLDIDLAIAEKKDNDNPVFYLQYAHARICQVLKQQPDFLGVDDLSLLTNEKEKQLLILINDYLVVIDKVIAKLQPHLLTIYLQKIAKLFHSYYNEYKIINHQNKPLTEQRLTLLLALKVILVSGLKLIGVSAPNQM